MGSSTRFSLLAIWWVALLWLRSNSALAGVSQLEAESLGELFVALTFTNTTPVTIDNACTAWPQQVMCDGNNSAITQLNFTLSQARGGTLPPALSHLTSLTVFVVSNMSLSGTLPPEYSAWGTSLTYFDVSSNLLTGTLPPKFSYWSHITVFLASYNQLSGTLPPEYSNMTRLEALNVGFNSLTGSFPSGYDALVNLHRFLAHYNALSGTLPPQYSSWYQIKLFHVYGNQLSGTLPSQYKNWTYITEFHVNINNISGELPTEYSQWGSSLHVFDASSNSLTGTLPPEYSNWSFLQSFIVSGNNFSGTLPPLYSKWGASLYWFDVSYNNFTGVLSRSFGNWTNVTQFLCKENQINGTLQSEFANMTSMANFDVSGNRISGSLPSSYSSMTKIQLAFFDANALTGTLPASYSTWTQISNFRVDDNYLNGTLPSEYSNWTMMQDFECSNNQIEGTLPPEFSSMSSMGQFDISGNRISGSLPSSYSSMIKIQLAFFDANALTGTLPASYSTWTQISNFRVDDNYFEGTLPLEYTSWTHIEEFECSNNSLSGALPTSYSTWTRIRKFLAHDNRFTSSLPEEYRLWSTSISMFDVQSNMITGSLPLSYDSWHQLTSFKVSNNRMNGTIPSNWDDMQYLQLFLLSNNSFVGTLPQQIFPALQLMSFSFNNISGELPPARCWPQLRILDAQDNTHLSGQISLFNIFLYVTTCGTDLCTAAQGMFLAYLCLPKHKLIEITNEVTTALGVISLLLSFNFTPNCSNPVATMAPEEISHHSSSDNDTVLPPSHTDSAAIISLGGISSASAMASAFASVDSADAQMLASIMGSPCGCSATAPTQLWEGSVLLLALSPFAPLGSAWAAIGNSLLCGALVGLHVLVVKILSCSEKKTHRNKKHPHTSVQHIDTALARWLFESGGERLRLIARLRFPNASCTLMLLLVPGVVRAVVDSANALSVSDTDDFSVSIAGICVGVVFVLCSVWCVEWIAYRHIDADVTCVRRAHSSTVAACLRFEPHKHPHKLFQPVPRSVAKIVLPLGCWQPQPARLAYGSVVSSYVEEWRRAWVVVPVANIVVQILSGVDVSGSAPAACDALQGLTLCVLACVCAFIAYARPHRALLASYLVCASLVLTMVTALLGLLCRHGAVSSDAVSGFGVFASVAMFVFKLYHVLMPIVEQHLIAKNIKECDDVKPELGVTLLSVAARKNRADHVNPSTMKRGKKPTSEAANVPAVGGGRHAGELPRQTTLQAETLRQLIEVITYAKRCNSLL